MISGQGVTISSFLSRFWFKFCSRCEGSHVDFVVRVLHTQQKIAYHGRFCRAKIRKRPWCAIFSFFENLKKIVSPSTDGFSNKRFPFDWVEWAPQITKNYLSRFLKILSDEKKKILRPFNFHLTSQGRLLIADLEKCSNHPSCIWCHKMRVFMF